MTREALFYKKLEDQKVKCELCPHHCLISDRGRGICGVRENQGGELISLVYGKLVSAQIDPIEKKPLFHFLPGSTTYSIATVGCNFRCDFCQNFGISQSPRDKKVIVGQETSPEQIVEAALESKTLSISYTYTEPTIYYEYALDCAKLAREKGLKNIFITNGYIDPAPLEAIAPYLDAANIDLKSFRDDFYRKICGGQLMPVLETIKLMKKLKIWIEVTTLIIPGVNDSLEELAEIAGFIRGLGEETPWHVSGFYPANKMLDRPPTPASALSKAREIGLKSGLQYVYAGNVPIPEGEDTLCPQCGKPLITRAQFRTWSNLVNEKGGCPACQKSIAGVWR
ncbi:AmmeMemoRadiSam system radical SAM enzyme [candidate division WOR-1 bacterium RIFOXYA12_FULL_52_29]|uniref:AmmeMemoRadiSam system radical SAM enzyme n=1 Tax=candidate division WOR-1 bacterium RIFOXYC12_FULL_54_18 TaxID=1802584 RepID=A0A1F4T7Q4_UNCSA|nr:MAG: AmmeMemoRadiSam system radical SAM enzyme [candidate division WOR-1 bacterium RIFOXYA2_FULL_51_19]OGC18414.1 MAG: AmmeMemoRadiSam system radical SAM enzyme [candidate division WOR-1 bacterium RIFOXYA12_FULL_52_29]OGC27268.1 MAG: AmmeMemoRadiSam system radical SAM enzyme [candidate division WOR-1 bacterium RIFOXYB2_FULL_45_9]OGC28831.1 MAG: AmmeMemoRadiSam system radical SAM enzyme [candidate division WOR-1 bacterium RIFOXYC12_FULL_54_18]OGC30660.1 MAG: AmmeMemoRadiSam system radical SAM